MQQMNEPLTTAPRREFQSFHDFPIVHDLDKLEADIAILGNPYGSPTRSMRSPTTRRMPLLT